MAGLTALLPLDGTKLAESAFSLLPLLKSLGFDSIRLVSVWESGWDEHERMEDSRHSQLAEVVEKSRSFLATYLEEHARRLREDGFNVGTVVAIGRPADEILKHAEGADLILIATHGRDGIARLRLGSVADKIIRDAHCPTLVIGPNVKVELAPFAVGRILVPLDGSALSETALPIATWIAVQEKAELDLVRVISLTPISYDPTMGSYPVDLLTAMEEAAKTYLARMAASVALKVSVSTALLLGSAGDQLLEYLEKRPAGLVVMASHGRTGIARAALGSVADRMLHGPAPVLILRPEEPIRSRLVDAAYAAG